MELQSAAPSVQTSLAPVARASPEKPSNFAGGPQGFLRSCDSTAVFRQNA
jgi:hypothetical protein